MTVDDDNVSEDAKTLMTALAALDYLERELDLLNDPAPEISQPVGAAREAVRRSLEKRGYGQRLELAPTRAKRS